MIRRLVFFLLVTSVSPLVSAEPPKHQQPKLVVVVSLDQFPFEYLPRFSPFFGKGGFRRLMDQGAVFANASYKHAMNETGPGHAVILSGTYGNRNGIVMNEWYDRAARRSVYCVEDTTVQILGGTGKGRSPRNFVGATFGDELRLSTSFASKVISMSNKDRAAILMAGRLANAAYWCSDSAFVTSTYYRPDLPAWVSDFNERKLANSYFGRLWTKRLPESAFAELGADDEPWESGSDGMGRTFPHRITGRDSTRITPSYYSAFIRSPFAMEYLESFAEAALRNEKLGKRGVTDLLCVSFSSTDYIGHAYGPHSHEILEGVVAVDAILAKLMAFLDREIGTGNYVIALTSDHGVDPIPEYILAHQPNASAGRVQAEKIAAECEAALTAQFGPPPEGMKWIEAWDNRNIYLRDAACASRSVSRERAAECVAGTLRHHPLVAAALTATEMMEGESTAPLADRLGRSYFAGRSGDVMYAYRPYYFDGGYPAGATHGAPYESSAHIPVIIAGGGITPGWYEEVAAPTDLAPTLSALVHIEFPMNREGRVLTEAIPTK